MAAATEPTSLKAMAEIGEKWPMAQVGDVFEIQQGKALSAAARTATERFPFLRTSNVLWNEIDVRHVDAMGLSEADRTRLRLQPGDLLVCEGGEIGRAAVWQGELGECYYQNHLHRLRPRGNADPDFYQYWLRYAFTMTDLYRGAGTKTTIENLSGGRLSSLPLPTPPLDEQQRIAHILAIIQRDEEVSRRTAGSCAALASSLKQRLFPRSLADAPRDLGRQRVSWVECQLGDQIAVQRGFDITKTGQRPGAVPVVSSGGVQSFHNSAKASAPGVVIGRKGSLGTAYFLDMDYWPHDTTLWVTDFMGNSPKFVYHFMRQLDVSHLDVGASNPTLNRNHLYPTRVVWPDLSGQLRIGAIMDATEASSDAQRQVSMAIGKTLAAAMTYIFGRFA
jgi:type I restriction enzyme, S subunit